VGAAAVKDLAKNLVRWCQKIDGEDTGDLLMCAAMIAANRDSPTRDLLEKARDKLSRAQERSQFSGEEDQQDLAAIIAALDELLREKAPTN